MSVNRNIEMPFGKYKGVRVRDIEDYEYLKWILPKITLEVIKREIRNKLQKIEYYAR